MRLLILATLAINCATASPIDPGNPKTKEGAPQQCFHWFLAASVAAKNT